ncbi:hypothetical protein [Ornithinimicrobium kibberense]|uniref:hypothetical protein n=1 Tax=Ornithinimicrobium kibberense TaxID=282060 RepID=UPI003609259C
MTHEDFARLADRRGLRTWRSGPARLGERRGRQPAPRSAGLPRHVAGDPAADPGAEHHDAPAPGRPGRELTGQRGVPGRAAGPQPGLR